jgi:hypothetical protein
MKSEVTVRRLTDRSTGRQIFRYASYTMSGRLPSVLYKYLAPEYAIALIERGELMFSTLSWFQNLEDRERGDEFEGTHKYFPIGGLEVTRVARDGKSHPPVTFTSPNDSLQSKARGTDHIFIYSMSLRPGLTQFADSAASNACVEIYDPAKFVARLRGLLRRTPRAKAETLIHDEVRYYSFADPPGNVYALPDRLVMHKHDGFRDQHEYRIAFGTRRDVFDFERIDYTLVRDGIQQPRRPLNDSAHRWRLQIGRLHDCARLYDAQVDD